MLTDFGQKLQLLPLPLNIAQVQILGVTSFTFAAVNALANREYDIHLVR